MHKTIRADDAGVFGVSLAMLDASFSAATPLDAPDLAAFGPDDAFGRTLDAVLLAVAASAAAPALAPRAPRPLDEAMADMIGAAARAAAQRGLTPRIAPSAALVDGAGPGRSAVAARLLEGAPTALIAAVLGDVDRAVFGESAARAPLNERWARADLAVDANGALAAAQMRRRRVSAPLAPLSAAPAAHLSISVAL